MRWIQKMCATAAVLTIAVSPFAAYSEGPKASDTEMFNPASGGESKGGSSAPAIPSKIAVSRIPETLTVNHPSAATSPSKAEFNRTEDASAPAKSSAGQGAPSEVGQK